MSTGKKIGVFATIVVVLVILTAGSRWLFFNVIKNDQVLDGLVEFRAYVARDMESGMNQGYIM